MIALFPRTPRFHFNEFLFAHHSVYSVQWHQWKQNCQWFWWFQLCHFLTSSDDLLKSAVQSTLQTLTYELQLQLSKWHKYKSRKLVPCFPSVYNNLNNCLPNKQADFVLESCDLFQILKDVVDRIRLLQFEGVGKKLADFSAVSTSFFAGWIRVSTFSSSSCSKSAKLEGVSSST